MRVYLATDHGGFDFKEAIKAALLEAGYEIIDCGNNTFDPNDDYPDFILPMAERLAGDTGALGIVFGRSGNGEQIAANKVRGIRAALCLSEEMARKAREHNNAQVLALGGDYMSADEALAIARVFLATPFSGDQRHQRRIRKLTDYESKLV